MIPDIAIMLAAYICFRMVEVWLFSPDRYRNAGSHTAAFILSLLVNAVTVLVLIMDSRQRQARRLRGVLLPQTAFFGLPPA